MPYGWSMVILAGAMLFYAVTEGSPLPVVIVLGAGWALLLWQPAMGRFWLDARRRKLLHYAVTTKRALIVSEPDDLVCAIPIIGVDAITIVQEVSRSSIRLRPPGWVLWWPGALWPGVDARPRAFELLDDHEQAVQAIEHARRLCGADEPLKKVHTRNWYSGHPGIFNW